MIWMPGYTWLHLFHFIQAFLSVCTWPGVSGESLLLQRQHDESDGGQLLTELLQDDDSSQQGQVLHPVDTPTGEHR